MAEGCNFCGDTDCQELFLTTRNLWGCADCLAQVARCCECAIVIEAGGGKTWEDGLAYCHDCAQGRPVCFCCSRPAFEAAAEDALRTVCVYCEANFPRSPGHTKYLQTLYLDYGA